MFRRFARFPTTIFFLSLLALSLVFAGCGGEFTTSNISSDAKAITAFSLTNASNTALAADATATISGTGITATVPFGTGVTALIATFILLVIQSR